MPPRDRTKRRVTPHQERAQASVEAILTAAEAVLAEEGAARATTNRIAARAGVNVALVYRYFAGKEAILGAIIERVAVRMHAAVHDVLVQQAGAPLPVAVRALLTVLIDTPGVPALHRELVENVDASRRRAFVQTLSAELMTLAAAFFAERESELRPLADREATYFGLQHAVEAATHAAAFYRPKDLSMDRVLDALTELVLRTLVRVNDGVG
jgi:AcrR family transcriptional regulator